MSRQAHANRLKSSANETRNLRSRGGNNREWTWPEGIRKEADAWVGERCLSEEAGEVGTIGDVHDERIKRWTTLRLEDPCNGRSVKSICAKAVDRLCRKGDKATRPNDRRGTRH
jgi:hypothetical protein